MSKIAIQCVQLAGGYGDTVVIDDVSLSVETGHVLGIIGKNGAGKTTLARLLSGVLTPMSGTIALNGTDVTGMEQYARRKFALGYAPQENGVFAELTVHENLLLTGATEDNALRRELLAAFPRLTERLHQIAGTMSGGERKILSFVRTLLEPTSIVILDEPTEGVQQENIERFAHFFDQEKQSGRTFVVIEQNINLLSAVADQFVGMSSGRIVLDAPRDGVDRDRLLAVLSL